MDRHGHLTKKICTCRLVSIAKMGQCSELYDNKTLKVSIQDESRCFTNLRSDVKMGSAPIYAPDRH